MEKVRIDKWLWSVRIFKSRTISTDACKSGRIKINEIVVKPAQSLMRGDKVEVRKNGFLFSFKVVELLDKRVGAPIAQQCYVDMTPADELAKYQDWFVGKSAAEQRARGAGRPTKLDRRTIVEYKEELFNFDDVDDEDD